MKHLKFILFILISIFLTSFKDSYASSVWSGRDALTNIVIEIPSGNTVRSGADTDLVNITSGGNVGIGKTPGYKLDVNGEINATNVRVNGVDINQMIKNQHLFSLYRVSITYILPIQ